jgi:hypothetical protein
MKPEHEEALTNMKEAFTICGRDSLRRIDEVLSGLPVVFDLINWQREEIERLKSSEAPGWCDRVTCAGVWYFERLDRTETVFPNEVSEGRFWTPCYWLIPNRKA